MEESRMATLKSPVTKGARIYLMLSDTNQLKQRLKWLEAEEAMLRSPSNANRTNQQLLLGQVQGRIAELKWLLGL